MEKKQTQVPNETQLNDQLWLAAYQGDVERLAQLVNQGADVNTLANRDFSPLAIAAFRNQERAVKFLLANHANVNLSGENGVTPLMLAVNLGCTSIGRMLLAAGADTKLTDQQGFNLFDWANQNLQKEQAQIFLRAADRLPKTLLFDAIEQDNVYLTKELLKNGLANQIKGHKGEDALMHAAKLGKDECLAEILATGQFDVNVTRADRRSALMVTAARGEITTAKTLLENGASQYVQDRQGDTALMVALKNQQPDMAQFLIQLGAPIDTVNYRDESALIIAVRSLDLTNAQELINCGADLGHRDQHGFNALMYAVMNDQPDMVKLLVNSGANPLVNCTGSDDLLAFAIKQDAMKTLSLMLSEEDTTFKPNWSQRSYDTALLLAAKKGNLALVERLIQLGAQLNATNENGDNALNLAIRQHKTPLAARLVALAKPSQLEQCNKQGNNALLLAAAENNPLLVRKLLEKGVSADKLNLNGDNALTVALKNQQQEVANLLLAHNHEKMKGRNSAAPSMLSAPAELAHKQVLNQVAAAA